MENRITTGTLVALACSAVLAYAAPQNRPHVPHAGTRASASHAPKHQQVTPLTACVPHGSSSSKPEHAPAESTPTRSHDTSIRPTGPSC
jgi:hypothetical protein